MVNIGIETESIEYKKTTGELKEGINSLASMLNKNGYGTLFFGVRDNGDVIGQQIGDRTLREISQAIANHIKPQIIPTISLELIDDCNVIKIDVSGSNRPYSAYGRYYMRSADEDRELTPDALRELMLKKASSDVITTIDAPRQDLSFGKLKIAFVEKGLSVDQQTFDQNESLKNEHGRYNLMAYLLADENDISIKVVVFAGKDKTSMSKRNEYGGKCLVYAMDQVMNYIESINETKVILGGSRRKEEKMFDFPSFKEAWQNACLHTKWERGNPPAVYVFADRIEIISTGGLPGDLNPEEFYRGISKPVNAKLQKIFGQLGYVEQTGHGVPLIVSNYGKVAFDIMENYLNVTIPFNFIREGVQTDPSDLQTDFSDAEYQIVCEMRNNPHTTIRDLVTNTGYSDGYVRKLITQLKGKSVIMREGSNKTGMWIVQTDRRK